MFLRSLVFLLLMVLIISIPPSKDPPDDFLKKLEEEKIPLESYFVDDSNNGNGTYYQYSSLSINTYIKNMRQIINKIKLLISKKTDLNIVLHQIQKQHWIIVALLQLQEEYSISIVNKRVLIVGSTEPWLEAICLVLGAANITTIDYNNLTYTHDQIETFNKYDFDMFYNISGRYVKSYDFVIGLRSFDHSGLGRYGDEIDYNGDIDSMNKAKTMMKDGGIFIFSVPIGNDLVIWNLQRRYGKKRLPKLIGDDFEEVIKLGWIEDLYDNRNDYRKSYDPVIIIKKVSHDEL